MAEEEVGPINELDLGDRVDIFYCVLVVDKAHIYPN